MQTLISVLTLSRIFSLSTPPPPQTKNSQKMGSGQSRFVHLPLFARGRGRRREEIKLCSTLNYHLLFRDCNGQQWKRKKGEKKGQRGKPLEQSRRCKKNGHERDFGSWRGRARASDYSRTIRGWGECREQVIIVRRVPQVFPTIPQIFPAFLSENFFLSKKIPIFSQFFLFMRNRAKKCSLPPLQSTCSDFFYHHYWFCGSHVPEGRNWRIGISRLPAEFVQWIIKNSRLLM